MPGCWYESGFKFRSVFFPGPVNPACWIQFVDFVIVKTAPQYSTPPAFLSVKCPQITPPGEGQTPIIWVIESE